MSARRRKVLFWIASLVLAAGLVTGSTLWLISRLPSLADQLPPNQSPLTVSILSPQNGTSWPADAFVPVQVRAASESPLARLEFWVDGVLIETLAPQSENQAEWLESIRWLPVEPGEHRLYAVVQEASGRRSLSNVISLTASEPAGFGVVEEGGSPAADLQVHSILPGGFSGQTFQPSPSFQEAAPSAVSFQPPSGLSLWLADRLASGAALPEAPELSYSLDGCNVNLQITDRADDELGYFIYRSSPGSSAFQRIGVLGKVDQGSAAHYSDPDQQGPLVYYVAAFNQAGEAPSNPVQTSSTDPACQAVDLPDGGVDGLSFSLPPSVNLAYVYYAYNGGGYARYPSAPDAFLTPVQHTVDLNLLVDSIVSWAPYPVSTVDLVLWGWEGGSPVNLGSFHSLVDRSDLTICNLGTGCTGDVAGTFRSTYGVVASNAEDQLHEFYWTTTAPGASEVLWQIATQPFPAGFQPHPAGLAAAGCQEGSNSGSFLVDFADLTGYQPEPTGCGLQIEDRWLTPQLSLGSYLLLTEGATYYARFTPMIGNQPAGKPSNTVIIHYGPGEDLIEPVIENHLPAIYQVEIVDFQPIHLMDFNYWGCVSIVSLDRDQIWSAFRSSFPAAVPDSSIDSLADDLYNELKSVMDRNLIVCPTAYSGSDDSSVLEEWGSSLVEGLKAFWKTVQDAFNSLKNTAVDLAAGALETIGIPCDATCRAGLRAGIEIGMTYFTGVPPTLPDFDQLVDEGIGYAIQLAAAEAGIPCPQQCQDALRSGLEEVADLVKQTNSQPACVDEDWAHVLGKNAFCFPEGVVTEPVPEGLHQPASAVVRITRPESTFGIPTPEYSYYDMPAYALRLRVFAENPAAAGRTYVYDYYYEAPGWTLETIGDEQNPTVEDDPSSFNDSSMKYFTLSVTPAEVAGQVFIPQTIPVPPLSPGGQLTIPMALGQDTYYFDEHLASLYQALAARDLTVDEVGYQGFMGIGGSQGYYYDWGCLYNGGTIKVEAELYCLSVPAGLSGTTSPTEASSLVPCGAESAPWIQQIDTPLCQP